MSGPREWTEWRRGLAEGRGGGVVTRGIEQLLNEEKVAALWISGSRAVGAADEHSDVDIRIHAPGWGEADFERWLAGVQPESRARWRLSKLGPTLWNYECLLAGEVPVDLLVFGGAEAPVVSVDSVIFKHRGALKQAEVSGLVKEAPVGPREVRALLDGAEIDRQKFGKLFARGERLGAWFLLEAVRFSAVRLAYVAVRGKDCGPKAAHTLASIKVVRQRIRDEGGAAAQAWLTELEAAGTLEDVVARVVEVTRELAGVLEERATRSGS